MAQPQLRPINTLGETVVFLLVAQVVLALAEAVALLYQVELLKDQGADVVVGATPSGGNAVTVIALIRGLVFIATVVFWCMWQHRVQTNAILLTTGGLEFTPGWAVGWWFIPIANLWKPWQAARELWKASHGGDAWRRLETWSLLGWWWAVWMASLVHVHEGGISFGTTRNDNARATVSDVMVNDRWLVVSLVLSVIAAFLAIKIVQAIGELQENAPRPAPALVGDLAMPEPPPSRPDPD
jgi:Domain of unknown function (DUF4328)